MRLLTRLEVQIDKLFPPGTFFNRNYHLAMRSVQIVMEDGLDSFWRRYRHYRRTKIKYARRHRQAQTLAISSKIFQVRNSEFLSPAKESIAVVVHVYYTELFDEICLFLKQMPYKYTLLISLTDEAARESIISKAKQLPLVEKIEIKIVENRGRDIAPFLVNFASELRKYDYICKIHTKKSLYTGSERTERRQYLLKMLLGSSDRIRAILTVFTRDRHVGIIYPQRSEDLPYWAYTWLSNKWIAPPVVNSLGLRFDPDEYLDFPAGSMFWVKRKALEPLLDMRFQTDDFPEERGQIDGALQHVLERCFALAAQSRCFQFAVTTDMKANIFASRDIDKISPYFIQPPQDKVRDFLSELDVVSFDIFDTLLSRPFASPDMVFNYLEDIVQAGFGIPGYYRLRKEAENTVRQHKNFQGDATISEIYAVLADMAHIDAATAGKLLDLEVATEVSLLIPRREVVDLMAEVKRSGKRVILVTDTYLEKEHLEKILDSKGIESYDQLYISSETGKRKDRGDMWDYVLAQEGIQAGRLMHCGDNEQSDIQVLGDRGPARVVHVMKPSVLFRQSDTGSLLWRTIEPYKGWRENLLFGMIGNYFCLQPYPEKFWFDNRPLSQPHALGYTVFGPMIHNFLSWLIARSEADGIKQLNFIAREGYALHKVYNLMADFIASREPQRRLPAADYFLCSRRAALFASLLSEDDIPLLLEGKFIGTLGYLFEKRLNASRANMAVIEKRLGAKALKRTVSLPVDYDLIKSSIRSVFDVLSVQAAEERRALLQYCAGHGISGMKSGLVDVGYSCSIQKALVRLTGRPVNGYYFVTNDRAANLDSTGVKARAYFGELVDPLYEALAVYKYGLLLEAILTSPDGQVVSFVSEAGGVKPVYKAPGISQREFNTLSRIHQGIMDFEKDMLDIFGSSALEIEFPKDAMMECYELVATGEINIGGLKSALYVEDEYCGNEEIPVLDYYAEQK